MSLSRPHLLFSLGLLLALLVLHAEVADALLLFPQVLAMALLVSLATLPYLAFGPRFRELTRYSLLALAVMVVSFPLALGIWRQQDQATHRRRAQVVAALEAYRRQRGAYPDSLAQLVPGYLPQLPATAYGLLRPRPFVYQRRAAAPTGYNLSYYVGALTEAHLSGSDGTWAYDD
ncbi:hypothetical protein EJV47_05800 [Hymenobacter gummosus]|uniref:Uncharacterized protein n=1 Tax=Hymenobacter gummosus TaxID=1776032 RepID=A0A431U753_9BACT|nr:hypothetical protein [Hymenobacter gummosus]RTQ52525.1 hypothetical protein EJV47_05800 [Hymenobacter gummosus]